MSKEKYGYLCKKIYIYILVKVKVLIELLYSGKSKRVQVLICTDIQSKIIFLTE